MAIQENKLFYGVLPLGLTLEHLLDLERVRTNLRLFHVLYKYNKKNNFI